ncbi:MULTISPECIES: MFS transporter [unclassified Cryobacterium]|uniref:MFS transporter n=2 Tax=Cryobacterium TaxID=69578 RepID=UPI00106C1320|nr:MULTISPECIES: MFS transporter [unclassified Cryobacterium]MDY7529749.1 MFS transporter [Cryobacterium sp. 10C2]MEB0202814.1 MFS transporter [Cryobacterium sp. 5I3]MEB0289489.1 MFS transporter [Cryobacterium sp. 10C2]TFB95742.1 MFS transporter [Cryobacterium sp. MDB2-A-1]TFC04410.1 MFS transporter [Cryobacterium sp. MDB2-33-2]
MSLKLSPDQAGTSIPPTIEHETMRRVTRRLMPLIMVCYFIAYIDRSNVSVASLTMNGDIGLSVGAYGFGAGLFFITYIIFEIPSNLALHKFGARVWIARIMISWGIVAACMALVNGPGTFNTVRLVLGAAEAGFTPGIIFYLSQWFPNQHRGRAMGTFYVGAALATVIGAPLSGLILQFSHGWFDIQGWRWLFILEAVPAVVLGIVVLKYFTDKPREAKWLPEANRTWLVKTLEIEKSAAEGLRTFTIGSALRSPGVILLAIFFFLYSFNSIGLTLWMPQVIQGTFGHPDALTTSMLTAIPYVFAVIFMIINGRSADKRGRRDLHMAIPMALAGVLLLGSVAAGPTVLGFALLSVSTGFAWSAVPAMWSTATAFMTGIAAAAGVALINATANIAGVLVPPLVGELKEATGSFNWPLIVIAAAMLLAAVVALISARYTKEGLITKQAALVETALVD